jgi:hypothetical protein
LLQKLHWFTFFATITLVHAVTITLDHTVTTMTLDSIIAFDINVTSITHLVALLTSSPVMWLKERQ